MKIAISFLFLFFFFQAFPQIISDSILVHNGYRTFHFNQLPATTDGASLIFILHGSGGDGRDMVRNTGKLMEIAVTEDILLVYPDGYKKYWNECRKAASSLANLEDIDENTFFSSMIDYFETRYHINK